MGTRRCGRRTVGQIECTDEIAKDKEDFKDSTQARLEGGADAGIKGNFSQCQKASSPPPQQKPVHLEMILKPTKEGPVIADKDSQWSSEEKRCEVGGVLRYRLTSNCPDQSRGARCSLCPIDPIGPPVFR
jgi:hypothetical protein